MTAVVTINDYRSLKCNYSNACLGYSDELCCNATV